MISSYRDLVVWQKSMDLVKEIYRLLRRLPREENYSLCDQMRRSAVSIPSNIAEGYARQAPGDYARFLTIARGSVFELQTQLLICERLDYLSNDDIAEVIRLCEDISKMLYSILAKL